MEHFDGVEHFDGIERFDEYERIAHTRLPDCSMFLVELFFRPLHMHREIELCYVIRGEAEVSNRKRIFPVKTGDILLFDSEEAHQIYGKENGVLLLAIQISKQFCHRYCPQIENTRFEQDLITDCFTPSDLSDLKKTMIQAFRYYLRSGIPDQFQSMSQVEHLFSLLLRNVPFHTLSGPEASSRAKSEERTQRILHFLEAHFREPVRLTELAQQEGLTETYLSHFFHKQVHVTFQEYLTSLRLEAAMYLLRNTSMSLTDISLECGFSDIKYLSGSFKKSFGLAPQQWRRSGTENISQRLQNTLFAMQHVLNEKESIALLDQL